MLRIYRICNLIMKFSKCECYNKLLGGVTLFRVTPSVTWNQTIQMHLLYIYIFYSWTWS